MKKFSILILTIIGIFYSSYANAWLFSSIKSTVPPEGGYGTVTDKKTGNTWTGTFERNGKWAKNVTFYSGDGRLKVVGDYKSIGGIFMPQSNKATLYDLERDIEFNGTFSNFNGTWDFAGGTVTYMGNDYQISTNGYWEAGNKAIEKYNTEIAIAKKEKKKSEEKQQQQVPEFNDNDIIPASSGSGFIINTNGTIVSNFHVIDSCQEVYVTKDGKKYKADVIAQDKFNDLSILKTNIKSDDFYSISSRNVFLLEDIIVAGFPLGKKVSSAIKTFEGSVSSLTGLGDNYSNFQIDANLNQGNSGGPIINFEGNVVGIAVAKIVQEGVDGFNFGIKSSVLKDFLDVNGVKYTAGEEKILSKKELSPKIVSSTVYIECWMTYSNLKKIIKDEYSQKAFFRLN